MTAPAEDQEPRLDAIRAWLRRAEEDLIEDEASIVRKRRHVEFLRQQLRVLELAQEIATDIRR